MSSTTTRPKPRPRARVRTPATTEINANVPPSSSPGPSSALSTTQVPQPTAALPTIEDEDALFIKTRPPQAWAQISKLTREKDTRKRKSNASDSSDDENARSSPRSRNRKKRTQKNDTLPDWTKREIVISSDSDSDSDIIIEDGLRPARTNGADARSSKRKSKRDRSRSITPPPAVPQYAIQRTREAVQQLVGAIPRAVSPTDSVDESMDTIVLDPELASIARRVQSEAMRGTTPAVESGGPEQVQIKIAWKPHPRNPNGQPDTWGITQKRHDSFHALFDEVADLASIRVDNLVICYEGKRIFPSSNPHGIGIWAEAEMEACDKMTYDYLQENRRMRSPSVAPNAAFQSLGARDRSPSIAEISDDDSGNVPAPSSDQEVSDAFHLIVRSEKTKGRDISLLVRPTTKCGAIVRAFLKKAGLEADYPPAGAPAKGRGRGKAAAVKVPALSVDGDKMDPEAEIGEADLEDGDQVEVVGL